MHIFTAAGLQLLFALFIWTIPIETVEVCREKGDARFKTDDPHVNSRGALEVAKAKENPCTTKR